MALILIAEDDGGTQRLIKAALRNKGHEVVSASEGLSAWRLIEMRAPELVVSDVNMPGMTGLALLKRLREHPTLSLTPFILLTSLQDRSDMRRGMLTGADDYLTKPLRHTELIEAVDAQLNRQQMRSAMRESQVKDTLAQALEAQAWDLHEQYENRLARELSEQWPQDDRAKSTTNYADATVLCADIRNYREWNAVLSPEEMGVVLKRFYQNSGDTVHLFGATAMHFVGEGVLAVFANNDDQPSAHHCLRALKAAMGLRKSSAAMDGFVRDRIAQRRLPPFEVGIALHRGPVAMARLEGFLGGAVQTLPVGETIVQAMAIQRLAAPSAGAVTVSLPVLRSITGAVKVVGSQLLKIKPDSDALEVCAVQPLGQ
jgi:DNA-binding response OmpR family regulator